MTTQQWIQLRTRRSANPTHRSVVVIDMAGSARRDNMTQLRTRMALDRMVRASLRTAGISRWRLAIEDRGDGMIVLLPATVSKVDILDPFVPLLASRLRDHNSVAAAGSRIRVRVAVHAGEVLRLATGWVGADLNLACRLVNSEPLYLELARHPSVDLVLAISEVIHDGIVRHGYRGIRPSGFIPVRVAVKEADTRAWLLASNSEPAQ